MRYNHHAQITWVVLNKDEGFLRPPISGSLPFFRGDSMLTLLITFFLACGACSKSVDSSDDTAVKQAE